MSQRDPVTDRGLLAAVVPQMAPGSSAQRFFAVVQKVFRAEVRHHTRGRVTLVGELRETFLEPFIPAQKGELRNELKGQLESSGENERAVIGPPDGGLLSEQLRRRPTA